MSFMFKPYRFTDPEALNRPKIPAATAAKSLMGNEAIAERLRHDTATSRTDRHLGLVGNVGGVGHSRCIGVGTSKVDTFGQCAYCTANAESISYCTQIKRTAAGGRVDIGDRCGANGRVEIGS